MTTAPVPEPTPALATKDPSVPPPAHIDAPGRSGRVNWTILLWAIGVPLPLVLIVALMRGCT